MTEAMVYNILGKEIGKKKLPVVLFSSNVAPHLVHEAVVTARSNARRAIAHTKTKGEVRGGGIKPWRQKGTGRARHGSIRSPLWKGGGVTFGPRNTRNYSKKMNAKAKSAALFATLSAQATDKHIVLLDQFEPTWSKTKEIVALLKILKLNRNVLIVSSEHDTMIRRLSQNIPSVRVNRSTNMNLQDLLWARHILMSEAALSEIETRYSKTTKLPGA